MRTGRPRRLLTLTEDEQERLQALAHRARSQSALALRARVVLACARGLANNSVAKKLRCSRAMVGKWRSRFLKTRLEGLYDEPRPGAPRKISDAQIEQIVVQTLEGCGSFRFVDFVRIRGESHRCEPLRLSFLLDDFQVAATAGLG
jgi:Winged helix-turn helix